MVASAFNQITVNSNYPSLQVVTPSAPPESVLLFNSDSQNTVWLADNNAVHAGDPSLATPLLPLSSVTFDGTHSVYAATISGQTANLLLFPSGSSYFQGSGIQPLAVLGSSSGGSPVTTVAPGGSGAILMNLVDVSGFTSYDFNTYGFAVSPGAVAAPLVFQVVLQWFDDLTPFHVPVFEEDWWLYAGRAAPAVGPTNYMSGAGPMHGRYLTVTVKLPAICASNMTLQYFNFFGSFRTMPYSDWRQNSALVNPSSNGITANPGGGSGFDNILCQLDSISLAAGQKLWIPLGLYAGPAYYHFQRMGSVATANDSVIIQTQGLASGSVVVGTACPGVIKDFQDSATGSFEQDGQVILPRAPTALVLSANGTSGNTYTFSLQAQQAA